MRSSLSACAGAGHTSLKMRLRIAASFRRRSCACWLAMMATGCVWVIRPGYHETFTTANPRYLRLFISSRGVLSRELPNSGRSTLSIIDLANALVDWSMHRHPVREVRDALHAPPFILPTPPGDPQPNPPDDPSQVHLVLHNYTADGEIRAVVDLLERWLPEHPDDTVAVLVSRTTAPIKSSTPSSGARSRLSRASCAIPARRAPQPACCVMCSAPWPIPARRASWQKRTRHGAGLAARLLPIRMPSFCANVAGWKTFSGLSPARIGWTPSVWLIKIHWRLIASCVSATWRAAGRLLPSCR